MYNDSAWDMVNGQEAINAIRRINENKVERRDFFAAQVFVAYMNDASGSFWNECNKDDVAKKCYEWADALENARSNNEN